MKNELIVFDSETTGMPLWKEPSEDEGQPRLVQLAAHVVDIDSRQIKQTLDVIIKPDGWTIPQETTDIHGITTEYACDAGVPEPRALEMFLEMWAGRLRVAFNTTFDNRIIRIGTKRYFGEGVQDEWKAGEYECAMIAASKLMPGGKWPKLDAAYKFFTDKDLANAHTAIADTNACLEIYWKIKDFRTAPTAA